MAQSKDDLAQAGYRLFRVLVLAGLVGNTTAGLACALAGGLALAAAAVDGALCHVTGIQSHDMLHDKILSECNVRRLNCAPTSAGLKPCGFIGSSYGSAGFQTRNESVRVQR